MRNAPGRGSARREEIWGCVRLLNKTEAAHMPITSCALTSDSVTEEIQAVGMSICKSAMEALDILLPGLDVGEMEPDDVTQS